jgi:predicted nuclease of predicted toxin-antitoxin system
VRLLFDECLPKRLTRAFPGHEAKLVQQVGWAGIGNGRLLALAAAFGAFVTVDANLSHQ